MQNIGLILLVFAFVLVTIEAWRGASLGWAGLACWIASELIGGLGRVFH